MSHGNRLEARPVRIRPADRTDVTAIARLHVAAWRATHGKIFSEERLAQGPSLAERERQWRRWFEKDDQRRAAWIAELDNSLVGMGAAGAAISDRDAAGVGRVFELYVDEEFWGEGVGKRLLSVLESYLRHRRFQQAVLWVLETNVRARGFYRAHGWQLDGARDYVDWLAAGKLRYRKFL